MFESAEHPINVSTAVAEGAPAAAPIPEAPHAAEDRVPAAAPRPSPWRSRALLALVLLPAACAMLWVSWRRWPGLWEDTGRELYIPWQILQGKLLYRDMAHLFGPLSQHLNAAVFQVLGTGFLPLALFNSALALGLAAMAVELFRRSAGALAAGAAGLTFLGLFAFSRYGLTGNFSYAFPYAHELVHGAFFSFAALLGFAAHLERPRLPLLAAVGCCAGLAALTKAEVFLALAPALAAGFAFWWLARRPPAREIRLGLLALGSGLAAPAAAFFLYFTLKTSASDAMGFLAFPFLAVLDASFSDNPYYRWVTGTDHPAANAWAAFLGLLCFGALLLGFLLHGACNRIPHRMLRRGARLLAFAGTAAIPLACLHPRALMNMALPFPALAALLAVHFGIATARCRTEPEKFHRALPLFAFAIFALLLMLKIFLKTTLWHYGFVLAMPAALLLAVFLTGHLPQAVGRIFGGTRWSRALGAAVVAAAIVAHVHQCAGVYALHTLSAGEGSDRMVGVRPELLDEGPRLQAALAAIEKTIGKDENFTVLPEGLILNYLSRRANPCKYVDFTPHLMAGFGEIPMVEALQNAAPDNIILIDQDTAKFGAGRLGIDYGVLLFSWVRDRYEPAEPLLNTARGGRKFGVILKRRADPAGRAR